MKEYIFSKHAIEQMEIGNKKPKVVITVYRTSNLKKYHEG